MTDHHRWNYWVAKGWTEVQEVEIPQWYGIHDRLVIFQRKVG